MWSSEKRKILTMKLLLRSLELLVLLLVQLLVLVLCSKIYHEHLTPIEPSSNENRTWRKCWKVAEIKQFKEPKGSKPVQIQRNKNIHFNMKTFLLKLLAFKRKEYLHSLQYVDVQ